MANGRRCFRLLAAAPLACAVWATGTRGWSAESGAAPPRVWPKDRAAIEFRFVRDRLTEADRRLLSELASFADGEGRPRFALKTEREAHLTVAWACWLLGAEALKTGQPLAEAQAAGGAARRALDLRLHRLRNDRDGRIFTAWHRDRPAPAFGLDNTLALEARIGHWTAERSVDGAESMPASQVEGIRLDPKALDIIPSVAAGMDAAPFKAISPLAPTKQSERPETRLAAPSLADAMNGWTAWRTLMRDEDAPALRRADPETWGFARDDILLTLSPSRVTSDERLNQGLEFAWKLHRRLNGSFTEFRRAAESADPAWTDNERGLAALTAWAIRQKAWTDALRLSESWIEREDAPADAWRYAAQAAWESQHVDETEKYALALVEAFPDSPHRANAYWRLGLVAEHRQQQEERNRRWQRLIDEYPNAWEARDARKRMAATPPAPPPDPPMPPELEIF